MMDVYDYVVLGGGSAGYNSAAEAARLGLRTAVVDRAEQLGGLCILRGCMPSKALLAAANRFREARTAIDLGMTGVDAVGFDMPAIAGRKRALISEFAEYRVEQLTDGRFDLVRGSAVFTNPHTVRVTEPDGAARELRAKTFLIASGSEHHRVSVPGLDEAGYWTSDDVLEMTDVPRSVVVLGGGAVALEFAHLLAALESDVTIIQRSGQILSHADADVAECVQRSLEQRGIRVFTATNLLDVASDENGVNVRFSWPGGETRVTASVVLKALGRIPATWHLGLEHAGVETDRKGKIVCQPTAQTSQPHIFAAGDVATEIEVVHEAVAQGELAARNARRYCDGESQMESRAMRIPVFAVFTHPEVAMAGLSEQELSEAGRAFDVARYAFADHGKAMLDEHREGFVKLIGDPSDGRLVGAAVVGQAASELIHTPLAVMCMRGSAQDMLNMPYYHPTLSEIWSYPAAELVEVANRRKS